MDQEGFTSEGQIFGRLGLSFPTMTRLVDGLYSTGELLGQGTGTSTGGRCAYFYKLDPCLHLYLLIQVEDGRVYWNVKDVEGEIVGHGEFCSKSFSPERLDSLIQDAIQRHRCLSTISIGIMALISHGIMGESTVFDCLKRMNLPECLKDVTCLPIMSENNMNYLTMGCWTGKQASVDPLTALFLNRCDIGGGMIIDNRLRIGASGFCMKPCFLPLMDRYQEGLDRQLIVTDVAGFHTRLIQIYACTISPPIIVLYHNPLPEGRLSDIRSRCVICPSARTLPPIELSKDYQKDCERGLFAMARNVSWPQRSHENIIPERDPRSLQDRIIIACRLKRREYPQRGKTSYPHIVSDIDNTLVDTTAAVLHSPQKAIWEVTGEHWGINRLTLVLGIPGLDASEMPSIRSPE